MSRQMWCPLRAWLADYAAGSEPQARHFSVERVANGYPVDHPRALVSTPEGREATESEGR